MQVPAFLLRRLYVRGSLHNDGGGFAFELKNSLGAGYAEQMLPLTVDGEPIPPEDATFAVEGSNAVLPFTSVSSDQPFTLSMRKTVTIAVRGRTLEPGKHKIGLGFVVTGMGTMQFDVTDAIEEAPTRITGDLDAVS
jgi:hypothetical protein